MRETQLVAAEEADDSEIVIVGRDDKMADVPLLKSRGIHS